MMRLRDSSTGSRFLTLAWSSYRFGGRTAGHHAISARFLVTAASAANLLALPLLHKLAWRRPETLRNEIPSQRGLGGCELGEPLGVWGMGDVRAVGLGGGE